MLTRRLLETYPYPTAIVDADGRVQRANHLAVAILSEDSRLTDAFGPADGERILDCLQRAERSSAPVMTSAVLSRDRSDERSPISITRISGVGEPLSFLVAINAFSRHRFLRLTERIEDLNRQMRETLHEKAVLQHALEANKKATRELYHRVRNNLQVMLSLARIGELDAAGHDAHTRARETHQRLRALAITQRDIRPEDRTGVSTSSISKEMISCFSESFRGQVESTWSVDDFMLTEGAEQSIALLINELFIAAASTFPDQWPLKLKVGISVADDDAWRLRLTRANDAIDRSLIERSEGSHLLIKTMLRQLKCRDSATDNLEFDFAMAQIRRGYGGSVGSVAQP